MDVTKFFEPVQKFVSFFVDRFSLVVISLILLHQVVSPTVVERIPQTTEVGPLLRYLEIVGLKGDNQTIVVVIVALFALVALLEIHEKTLRILNLLSPIQFSTHSYYGESIFYSHAPLLWRGYSKQLDFVDLKNLYELTVTRLSWEQSPVSRRSEIFDFIPAWLFMLLLVYVFMPSKFISASLVRLLALALFLICVGYVWQLFRSRQFLSEALRARYLALGALLDKKPHDFEELTPEQVAQVDARRKSMTEYAEPWNVTVVIFPWMNFVRDANAYRRSRAKMAANRNELRWLKFWTLFGLLSDGAKHPAAPRWRTPPSPG